jgi:LDH2 family malate/lactate/ureidoglycolate dehydrogenase
VPAVPADELTRFARAALVAIGFGEDDAATTARCLVDANLRGIDGHGVLRLVQYADSVAAGDVRAAPDVRVLQRGGARALVDAGGGYGFTPTLLACDLAAEIAAEHGLAVVGVRDSHHFGVAGTYAARLAARHRLVGIVLTNAQPIMAPPGITVPLVGNNPVAIAAPRGPGQPPLVFDIALSQTALGPIRLAAAEGREIPLGWAHDEHGEPTTDAAAALAAGLLAPTGGHKGLGLALMVDLLAGVLTGSPAGLDADAHGTATGGVGHLVLALSPALFTAAGTFEEGVDRVLAGLTAHGAQLPGEREQATERTRLRDGVPVTDGLLGRLADLAGRLGVAPIRHPAGQ